MTILLSLLSKYWKHILLVILISILAISIYNKIYDRGFQDATQICNERIAKIEKFRDEQITGIEGFAKTTLEQTLINQANNTKELRDIANKVKDKSLTNVECSPNTEFTTTYNAIITRGNKK